MIVAVNGDERRDSKKEGFLHGAQHHIHTSYDVCSRRPLFLMLGCWWLVLLLCLVVAVGSYLLLSSSIQQQQQWCIASGGRGSLSVRGLVVRTLTELSQAQPDFSPTPSSATPGYHVCPFTSTIESTQGR